MAKIEKVWSHAGSLPGQYQKLTIEYESRSGGDVKVSYHLYIKSLGTDNYSYGTRHNKFTIFQPNDTRRVSDTYQAKGTGASRSFSGSFTIKGVGDNTKKLTFYYRNSRVWATQTNSWDPRSTGVVSKTKVGELSIPENTQHSIVFKDIVNNKNYNYSCYHNKSFTIPYLQLSSNYYDFVGWTSVNYAPGYSGNYIPNNILSSASPNVWSGNAISKVTKNLTFYSIWKPKTCTYKFNNYKDIQSASYSVPSSNVRATRITRTTGVEISELAQTHTWNTTNKLVDLDTIRKDVAISDQLAKTIRPYKVPGYRFSGWRSAFSGNFYSGNSMCSEWPYPNASYIVFNPERKAKLNTVQFMSDNNEVIYSTNKYYTDTTFDMYTPLSYLDKTEISIKPGYKLIGWSTVPAKILWQYNKTLLSEEGIAFPTKGYSLSNIVKSSNGDYYEIKDSVDRIYPTSGNIIFDYASFKGETVEGGGTLTLYPYYEYYTTTYVYYDGQWRLAMPYIYQNGQWNMALSYIYTEDGWKL